MNEAKGKNHQIPDLKTLFPVLSKDVAVQRVPPDEYRVIVGKIRLGIPYDTFRLFLLSNGSMSIYEIMNEIGEEGDADDEEQQANTITFLQVLREKGILSFSNTKVTTSRQIKPIGSFKVYYPFHLSVELTYQCNLRCSHCYIEAGSNRKSDFIPTKQLLSLLNYLYDQGLRLIELTGGESLLHPDFFTILEFCTSKFPGVFMFTNGTLITEKEVEKLRPFKENFVINISLDGSTPEIHDKIRQTPGSFKKTTNAIRQLSKQGVKVRAAMVTFPETEYDVENTILLAKRLGADSFTFGPSLPFGRAEEFDWNPVDEEIRAIEQYHLKTIEKYRGFLRTVGTDEHLEREMQETKNCSAGCSRFVMSPKGEIRPCHVASEEWFSFGNLLQDSPETVFSNPIINFFKNLDSPKKDNELCKDCKYRLFCNRCFVRGINRNIFAEERCPWFKQSGIDRHLNVQL